MPSFIVQARAAAASAICAHVLASQQRQQLIQWRDVTADMRSVRLLLQHVQRRRAQRKLEAAFLYWRSHLTIQQGKKAQHAAVSGWAHRRRLAAVIAAWAHAAKDLAVERDAALQRFLDRRALRSTSVVCLAWSLQAHEAVAARSAALARLSTGLQRCRLRTCFAAWAARTAASRQVEAVLEGHARRRRRRQLRGSFLAWSGAAREAAAGRDVLAVCFASNAADRQRAAVLEAWAGAARRFVYVRAAVARSRHVVAATDVVLRMPHGLASGSVLWTAGNHQGCLLDPSLCNALVSVWKGNSAGMDHSTE